MYAEVIIEYNSKQVDKTFTYLIPEHLNQLRVGMKVKVPFVNKLINGFVLSISDSFEGDYEVLLIDSIIDEDIVLSEELLGIGHYLADTTVCSKITAFQTMLPSAFKIKSIKNYNKYEEYIELESEVEVFDKVNKTAKKQIELINELLVKKRILKKEVNYSTVRVLKEKGIIRVIKEQIYRLNEISNESFKVLTDDQNRVVNDVNLNSYGEYLLYGVTGSGKTEVYMEIIRRVISSGKEAILLVPEISLTTQIVDRFYKVFGSDVAILHSSLSDGEKYDEYLKVVRKEVKIVIGARSAIFAPFDNLGVIIIDEEHSDNYKQNTTPRYHALDIAKFRAKNHNVPLLMGSATPSLESMARALKGVYKLLKLEKRIGNAILPDVSVVDMALEVKKGNWIFSDLLINKIKEKLDLNEQIILLLNRRGHSTTVSCSSCGFVHKCPKCDITLTYHKTSNNLRCHYCGYTIYKKEICPECREETMKFLGLGTEKLEDEINKLFPSSRVVRMDVDTTSNKGSHKKIIDDFSNYQYDILLGTQMVSKGLDFKNVTLVGVVNADSSLNIPDFRSVERSYSLLSQVAGRAGRGDKKGEVVIQSFNTKHFVMNAVINNSYEKMFSEEMYYRKLLGYPPYYYLTSIKIAGKDYEIVSKEINKVKQYLLNKLSDSSVILGPTPASNFRINNVYRFQLIIKYKSDDKLIKVLKELDGLFLLNKNCFIEIDINPLRI